MLLIVQQIKQLWNKKPFAVGMVVITLLSYITLLTNPTVGIDDTAFKVYFVDGVAPVMGRWCLYLVNKIIPLDYNPFFVETVGLMLFALSVSVWCVLFERLLQDRVSVWGYLVFGGVMISSPILSEIVVWYLQNGLYVGYGVTALSVLFLMDAWRENASRKKRIYHLFCAMSMLTVAVGFYESLMIVFLMAAFMVFLLIRVTDNREYRQRPFGWLWSVAGIAVGTMVLRTLIVKLITAVFHLEGQKNILKSRGLYEVIGWFDGTRSWEEFVAVLQEFLVKYYFNGIVYLPVFVLVLAEIVLVVWGIRKAVCHKDGWIVAAVAGILLLPWVMPILEGQATFYRAAQFVPLLTAFAVLPVAWWLTGNGNRLWKYAGMILAFVLLYQQGYEMNKWLYVDAMKYEDTKRTMDAVALTILEECDGSKPVCVIGNYETPESLLEDVYCPTWSKKYQLLSIFVKGMNEELFKQYNTPLGYATAETPRLSLITWGATAFHHFDRELIKFWKMHGFSFAEDGNLEHIENAKELMKDGPAWPKEGSIVEMEDHIIVNFGNY